MKCAETRLIFTRELVERPGPPSKILREIEAEMIGRLDASVARDGRRFDSWPMVTLVAEEDWLPHQPALRLVAEVLAI